jgi:hypothetical protein
MSGLAKVRIVPTVNSPAASRRPLILAIMAGFVLLVAGVLYLRDSDTPDANSPHVVERQADLERGGGRVDRLSKLREMHRSQQPAEPDSNAAGGKMQVPGASTSGESAGRIRPRQGSNAPAGAPAAPPQHAEVAMDEDPDDLPSLKRMALEDTDTERRLAAVTLLGASDDPQAIPILAQALQDQDEEVRLAAIQSLADVTGEVPVDVLGNAALNDPSADNRYEALEVLADAAGAAARPYIEKALRDSDEEVREFAQSLLENEDEDEAPAAAAAPH